MKKECKWGLSLLAVVVLAACGTQTGQSEKSSQSEAKTSMSSAETSKEETSSSKKVDDGHQYYQTFLNQVQGSGKQYAFYDLNKDGVDELVVGAVQSSGGANFIESVYALQDKQPVELLSAGVTPVGGSRTGMKFYDDGTLAYISATAYGPNVEVTAYKLQDGALVEQGRGNYQMTDDTTPEAALGLSAKEVTAESLAWQDFPTGVAVMNLEAIQAGDFSSIAGTWQNGEGSSYTFDANGVVEVNGSPVDMEFRFLQLEDGSVRGGIGVVGARTGSAAIAFIPAGQPFPEKLKYGDFEVDNSKDLIYMGQNVITSPSSLFYRVK